MTKLILFFALPVFAAAQQNGPVSALTLGCVGDGSTNNNACMSSVGSSSRSVYFPPGTYSFSSSITIDHPIIISGEGNTLSVLKYIGGGMTPAIIWNPTTSSLAYGMGMRDIQLTGTSNNGLLIGGSNQPAGFECFACRISGFTVAGVSFGDNAWNTLFDHSLIFDTPVVIPAGLSLSGEENMFSHTTFSSGTGYASSCVNVLGIGNFVFDDDSFDGCQFVLANSGAQVSLRDSHFEAQGGTAATVPYVVLSAGILEMFNPNMYVDSFNGLRSAVNVSGGMLNIIDGNINVRAGTLPAWVTASSGTVNVAGSAYLGNVASAAVNTGSATINVR